MKIQNNPKKYPSIIYLLCLYLVFTIACDNDSDSNNNDSPPIPEAFTITKVTTSDSEVNLTWETSKNAASYSVKYGTASGDYTTEVSTEATSPFTVTGLNYNTTYYFMVTAVNSSGVVNATNEVTATPNFPAPGEFSIVDAIASSSKVILTWGASANAASYTVKYGPASGDYTTEVSTKATSPFTIDGLTNGSRYYFMVVAVNDTGTQSATKEISATLPLWKQGSTLKGSNTHRGDKFGYSIAISGDTIVVGATGESNSHTTIVNTNNGETISDDDNIYRAGAAYVFKRSDGDWQQEAYLKAPNVSKFDAFGHSIAISGDTIVVGSTFESNSQTTITNISKGETINDNDDASRSGAAYVFKRSNGIWKQEAYLKASNGEASDYFGESVSISEDTIVVGAYWESNSQATITNGEVIPDEVTTKDASGAAYIFKRSNGTWKQEAYLKAPNPDANDLFGISTAISKDTIVVGAILEDNSQTTITNGEVIPNEITTKDDSGAAYVFKRSDGIWKQEAYLKASNADTSDQFGYKVAISDDTIVVGAFSKDSDIENIAAVATGSNSGAAYVFKRSDGIWKQEAYLKASNADTSDHFGYSVAISGDTIVVGAVGESSSHEKVENGSSVINDNNNLPKSGAGYVFRRSNGNWKQEAYLKTDISYAGAGTRLGDDPNLGLGASAAISANTIVLGATCSDKATIFEFK